ncbi:MAG: hypothetical protein ACD_10C00836G0002 [uncultured bacterium]|nr:MAG: hypothetical protein ACD_10C00836G0002 [uncultured bacterium]
MNAVTQAPASADDLLWFQERPMRNHRIRPVLPEEIERFGDGGHVLVWRTDAGEFAIQPLSLQVPAPVLRVLATEAVRAAEIDALLNAVRFTVTFGQTADLGRIDRGRGGFGRRRRKLSTIEKGKL